MHYADHQLHRVRVSRQARLSSGHGLARIQVKRSHDLCVGNHEKTQCMSRKLSAEASLQRFAYLRVIRCSGKPRTLITFLLLLRQ